MLTLALLSLAPVLQQASDSVQRQLNLHEVADLVDPSSSIQDQLALDLLYTTSVMALADPHAEGLDSAESAALSWLALGLQHKASEQPSPTITRDALLTQAWTNSAIALLGADAHPRNYPFDDHDQLIQVITTFMDPPFANSGASLKIENQGDGPILISYLTEEQQQWLESFLQYQRGEATWQGLVQVEMYEGDLARIADLDAEIQTQLLKDPAALEARRDSLKEHAFESLHDMKILLNPYQDGELKVAEQISYVSDWNLYTVQPGGQEVADPTVEIMEEGLEMECRIWQAGDAQYGMHFDLNYSEILRPIETHALAIEGAHGMREFTYSQPRLQTREIEADVRMQDGSSLQILKRSPDGGADILLLISFRALPIED